ncbi:hypothetical protein E4T56_gene8971, partial [Termitomyces sp. T112]
SNLGCPSDTTVMCCRRLVIPVQPDVEVGALLRFTLHDVGRGMHTSVTTRSPKPRTSSIKPPNPQKDPQRSAELPPMPTPTSANSDTSPANSDGP